MTHESLRIIREEHAALAAMLRSLILMVQRGPKRDTETFFSVLRAMLFYVDEFPERLHHTKETDLLFPKIREIDRVMTPALQERVIECHPELAFWALNGEAALTEPKKVRSRPWPAGLDLRRQLLVRAGYRAAFVAGHGYRNRDVGIDDLLDACACAAAAARIQRGEGRRFPESPPIDAKGLRMEIWG